MPLNDAHLHEPWFRLHLLEEKVLSIWAQHPIIQLNIEGSKDL
jgi:hypothetical protein